VEDNPDSSSGVEGKDSTCLGLGASVILLPLDLVDPPKIASISDQLGSDLKVKGFPRLAGPTDDARDDPGVVEMLVVL
jgi:hypothetical protein